MWGSGIGGQSIPCEMHRISAMLVMMVELSPSIICVLTQATASSKFANLGGHVEGDVVALGVVVDASQEHHGTSYSESCSQAPRRSWTCEIASGLFMFISGRTAISA